MDYRFLQDADDLPIEQITDLYRLSGWWGEGPDRPEHVRAIVRGSHCFLVVKEADLVIGMGRAVSDRASDAYVQDVTVRAAWRGRGVGTELVRRIVERLEQDGLGWIGLVAEPGRSGLYQRLGFAPMEGAVPMLRRS